MTHDLRPIAFAHRGGMAHFPENSAEAFRHAIESGVNGLEGDVQLTADGQVILAHDLKTKSWLPWRRRAYATLRANQLGNSVLLLSDLYEMAGTRFHISLDVKDQAAAERVVDVARSFDVTPKLWLAHGGYDWSDWRFVARWRELDDHVHLIDSTSIGRFDLTVAGYVSRAADHGIEVINLPADEWTPALVEVVKSSGLMCFAFDAQKERRLRELVHMGIDGVYSDHVDRLVTVLSERAELGNRPNP